MSQPIVRWLGVGVLLASWGAIGCGSGAPLVARNVTFNKHIAPIIYTNCVPCHRPGQPTPFALMTYADVKTHADGIGEETLTRHMPPWLPERGDVAIAGERRLRPEQIDTIQRWIATGMAEGDAADAPPVPVFPDGWQLGSPSEVLTMARAYTVPAGGDDVYRNVVLHTTVPADTYVRALEFRTNGAPIHHAVIRIDRSTASRRRDGADGQPGFAGMSVEGPQDPGGQFVGWAPGRGPIVSPDGMPWLLPRGADLVVEMHMVPQKSPRPVQPSIGLFYTSQPPVRSPVAVKLGSKSIDIPPGARDYTVTDSVELPVAAELMSLYPHAHYLGKEMRVDATLPNGTKTLLLHIKRWNFHWQQDYRFVTPVMLPRGTRIAMTYVFDNSDDNTMNPSHPPVRVQLGPRSVDEMAELGLQFIAATPHETLQLERVFDEHAGAVIIAAAEARVQREPNVAQHHAFLGASYVLARRYADAIAPLEAAVRLDDRSATAHSDLGTTLLALRRAPEAIIHLRRASALAQTNETMHFNLGNALGEVGQVGPAVAAYERALALNPEFVDAHINLGALLMSRGQVKGALPHFERAVQLDPGSAATRTDLSSALAASGRFQDALAQVRQALSLDPAFAPALENLRRLQQMGVR
ncbi:MAG: tetratricopeptide repeat protein [Acidobacteria bacterium]|nr:tetratricopeptide repeat protein [Acidobacteriota bacterium]